MSRYNGTGWLHEVILPNGKKANNYFATFRNPNATIVNKYVNRPFNHTINKKNYLPVIQQIFQHRLKNRKGRILKNKHVNAGHLREREFIGRILRELTKWQPSPPGTNVIVPVPNFNPSIRNQPAVLRYIRSRGFTPRTRKRHTTPRIVKKSPPRLNLRHILSR